MAARADGCVDVTYWVFAPDVENAARKFARAAEMVDYFSRMIGPFPFEKMANVQSATRFGGMVPSYLRSTQRNRRSSGSRSKNCGNHRSSS